MSGDDPDDDDVTITPEEVEAAKRAWVAEGRIGAGSELFARPVHGPDGRHGDVPLGDPSDLEPLIGRPVTAKRLGWDDGPEYDDPDRTPYDEMGYDSPDLAGELTAIRFPLPDGTPGVGWAVGGQPADPRTIRPREVLENKPSHE